MGLRLSLTDEEVDILFDLVEAEYEASEQGSDEEISLIKLLDKLGG